jgi:hypothetical protein
MKVGNLFDFQQTLLFTTFLDDIHLGNILHQGLSVFVKRVGTMNENQLTVSWLA